MNQTKMTPYLSDKIRVMSFVCIMLVVWIHTYYTEGQCYTSTMFLMNFWGCGVCTLAVPMFYTISGYLFFLGTMEKGVASIFTKQKKRVRTLFVPYLLTNLLSLTFYYSLRVVTQVKPAVGALTNNNLLDRAEPTCLGVIKYCLWDGPIAFQMWFVRDLMVLVALAPIIYYILSVLARSKWMGCLGIITCALVIDWHVNPLVWAAGWFILGGVLSTNPFMKVEGDKYSWIGYVLAVISITVIAVDALYAAHLTDLFIDMDYITISGVPAAWIIYDKVFRKQLLANGTIMKILCGSTFFVYLIHEPFLNIFKKIPFFISRSEMFINISYILCPIVFVLSAIAIGVLFKKTFPRAYNVFTGGR